MIGHELLVLFPGCHSIIGNGVKNFAVYLGLKRGPSANPPRVEVKGITNIICGASDPSVFPECI